MCTKVELGGTYWENDIQQMDAEDNRMKTMETKEVEVDRKRDGRMT